MCTDEHLGKQGTIVIIMIIVIFVDIIIIIIIIISIIIITIIIIIIISIIIIITFISPPLSCTLSEESQRKQFDFLFIFHYYVRSTFS